MILLCGTSCSVVLTWCNISTQSSVKPSWLLGSPGAQWVKVTMCSSDQVNIPDTNRSLRPVHTSLVAAEDNPKK